MRPERNIVIPFPGHPAADLRHKDATCASGNGYGLRPTSTAVLKDMIRTLHATLDHCEPHAFAAAAKASMRGYLCEPELLTIAQRQGSAASYQRHLLYAAPNKQFSVLAIVWQPGQMTPIHGHTAWGAVGVYSGAPYCEVFDTNPNSKQQMHLHPTMKIRMQKGDLATVQPGIDDVHRIGNDGLSECITLHTYGRDLLASPRSINIIFN